MIRKILVIDDSPIARIILRNCMPRDREYEFTEAENGEDGVNRFLETRPDVTFLDLTMPVMDGFEALERIKELDAKSVVIMCTADIQPKTILRVGSLGALTVIKKPPSKETVLDALLKAEEILAENTV